MLFNSTNYLFVKVARETNEELRAIKAHPSDDFNVGSILSIAKRCNFFFNGKQNVYLLLETCNFI